MLKQSDLEVVEIEELETRIKTLLPRKGKLLLDETKFTQFTDFPLSSLTLRGLGRLKFTHATEIQRQTLLHALSGRDILGAAKTGSGKTLAFLLPLVELLFRNRTSRDDGSGVSALVISPTRELATQIYEMARVITSTHAFTVGLLVGGVTEFALKTSFQLVVGTPGRILQHLEQSPEFDASQLRVLVLDEADRLLDMGFETQLANIISYLPSSRQTMLFSATQTKRTKDLARLSLSDPEFITCFSRTEAATPALLSQMYVVCEVDVKLALVCDFLRHHCEERTIVFFSSCRQVKFVEIVFRRMRIGLPVFALHGKQSAERRRLIYDKFVAKKSGGAVLLATDVASRGLDFPALDWVLQADCPEDAAAYLHRVGRTARNGAKGKSLLLLLPKEEVPFLAQLTKEYRVRPLRKRTTVAPAQTQSRVADLVVKDPELRLCAQKAFKSYLKSIHLQPNTAVFSLKNVSFAKWAASLGLGQTPRVKFGASTTSAGELGRQELRLVKNQNRLMLRGDDDDDEEEKEKKSKNKAEKLVGRKPVIAKSVAIGSDSDSDDAGTDFFVPSTATAVSLPSVSLPSGSAPELAVKMKRPKVLRITDGLGSLKGVRNQVRSWEEDEETEDVPDEFLSRVSKRLRQEDATDRAEAQKRVREMHRKIKADRRGNVKKDSEDEEEGDDLERRAMNLIMNNA